ncbi:MAG TPA: hypothetical protein VHM25_05215 [Polyangiaceae bacterium]|nr:hypothetical protein [Polyangiaceae bacterium]
MPTFLTTRQMSPELAKRVQASVSGRRAGGATRALPRLASLLRVGAVLAVIVVAGLVIRSNRRAAAEVARQRDTLLARVRAETADVTPQQLGLGRRVESLVADAAGVYAGDWVADELKGEEAFSKALGRQMVYVRGPLSKLGSSAGFKESAAESFKDAFSACLLEPPATRTERALSSKARAALGQRGAAPSSVERIQAALVSLPLLLPEWQARVRAADIAELTKLAATLSKAPLGAAKRAMKAELLLLVIDEPGDTQGPTELDGERAHWVRVQLVELASAAVPLRLRLRVDPSWISPSLRAEHASGIDSCALALDVRTKVGASPARHVADGMQGPRATR